MLLENAGRDLHEPAWSGAPHTLADELLVPSVVYAPAIAALLRHVDVRAVAHVTGGGLPGNLARVLPDGADAQLDPGTWEAPRIFGEIQRLGEVSDDEMRKVFNLGIGMVVVVAADEVHRTLDLLRTEGHRAVQIGEIVSGHGQVRFGSLAMTSAHAALVAHLLEHSVRTGDFTLKSGKRSSWFIDAKQTTCRADGMLLVADAALEVLPDDVTAIGGLTMGADAVAFGIAAIAATRGGSCAASACARRSRTTAAAGASPARWSQGIAS